MNRFIGINGYDSSRTKIFKLNNSETHISPCLEKGVKNED